MRGNPSPARDIGDGKLVSGHEKLLGLGQLGVHHAVQTACFVLVPVDAVLDTLRGVACMMSALSFPRHLQPGTYE